MYSLVIPLYNKQNHIERAVDSALRQTKAFQEIIIVDDGSEDDGASLIEKRYAGKVKLVKQPNRGVSAARNAGIHKATSKFVCLLDADDELEDSFLETIDQLNTMHPDCKIFTVSHYVCIAEDCKARNPEGKTFKTDKPVLRYAFNYGLINSSSVCMEREVLLQFPFPEGVKDGEDIYVWLRAFSHHALVHSAMPLVLIHKDADNRSALRDDGIPYHLSFFLDNPSDCSWAVNVFLFLNAIRQCYGYSALGRKAYVANTLNLLKKKRPFWYLLASPSLIVSPRVFFAAKKILGRL
ncbi:glycosyltransferase family 2 protein [Halomonas nitroreducens]|uniref:Glycosyltransferase family 2 protein n=1 Tax=Halomonas nitroreducens TaxID=447425 RepID=A0A431UY12_9GAMM|nr:glycosyltransferase family 2 protein [Halomonas nitroreducens]RTQ97315.1 glycosyltransferase family 2 protein [Halomonas nitroreducens]